MGASFHIVESSRLLPDDHLEAEFVEYALPYGGDVAGAGAQPGRRWRCTLVRMPRVQAEAIGDCPHCGQRQRFETVLKEFDAPGVVAFEPLWLSARSETQRDVPARTGGDALVIRAASCTHCYRISLVVGHKNVWRVVWPMAAARPVPSEVADDDAALARDYFEASMVLNLSPRASAALARRCLEAILVAKTGAQKGTTLDDKIKHAEKQLPDLADHMKHLRDIGNFASHLRVHKETGEVVEVTTEEAEWTLEVVEMLFDRLYVGPQRNAERRAALEAKMNDSKRAS